MNSMVPPGAKVLAALDYPALLSFNKYQFATLDLVSAASPSPGMPYFTGPLAKVAYLRSLGSDYIVAEAPSDSGLYDLQTWSKDYCSAVYAYRQWAPYFLDWQNTVSFLERSHHIPGSLRRHARSHSDWLRQWKVAAAESHSSHRTVAPATNYMVIHRGSHDRIWLESAAGDLRPQLS